MVSGAVGACCSMLATEMVSAVGAELAAAMPVAVMPPMAVADWVRSCWVPGLAAAAAARGSVGAVGHTDMRRRWHRLYGVGRKTTQACSSNVWLFAASKFLY
jgi:hypothetical protein